MSATTLPSFPPNVFFMTESTYTLDRDAHQELNELLEDTVAYFCNEHMISGELAWVVTQCFATAKVEQFKGNVK